MCFGCWVYNSPYVKGESTLLDFSELQGGTWTDHQANQETINELRMHEGLDVPWELTDAELWANYTNDTLYELDKKLREFLQKTRWKRERKKGLKTAVPLVFFWMFGRPSEPKDSQTCSLLHRLMRYYCTRYTGKSSIDGKTYPHVYYFSTYAGRFKRPYSLRLRLEEAEKNGTGFGKVFTPYGTNIDKSPKGWKTGYCDRITSGTNYRKRSDNG